MGDLTPLDKEILLSEYGTTQISLAELDQLSSVQLALAASCWPKLDTFARQKAYHNFFERRRQYRESAGPKEDALLNQPIDGAMPTSIPNCTPTQLLLLRFHPTCHSHDLASLAASRLRNEAHKYRSQHRSDIPVRQEKRKADQQDDIRPSKRGFAVVAPSDENSPVTLRLLDLDLRGSKDEIDLGNGDLKVSFEKDALRITDSQEFKVCCCPASIIQEVVYQFEASVTVQQQSSCTLLLVLEDEQQPSDDGLDTPRQKKMYELQLIFGHVDFTQSSFRNARSIIDGWSTRYDFVCTDVPSTPAVLMGGAQASAVHAPTAPHLSFGRAAALLPSLPLTPTSRLSGPPQPNLESRPSNSGPSSVPHVPPQRAPYIQPAPQRLGPDRYLSSTPAVVEWTPGDIERQFAFLQALAPRLPLVKPSFSREEIRLLAYETDPNKLPSLDVPHDANYRKLISWDERHAMEKVWRDGPFIQPEISSHLLHDPAYLDLQDYIKPFLKLIKSRKMLEDAYDRVLRAELYPAQSRSLPGETTSLARLQTVQKLQKHLPERRNFVADTRYDLIRVPKFLPRTYGREVYDSFVRDLDEFVRVEDDIRQRSFGRA